MSKPELKLKDDEVYIYTPLPQYGEGICEVKLVMTKDIFKECYKRWIKSEESKAKSEAKHTDKGCESCKFVTKSIDEEPCKNCKHSYMDKWQAKR